MRGKRVLTEYVKKLIAIAAASVIALSGLGYAPNSAFAAESRYITDVSVGSYDKLESGGYSVMSTSLTISGKKMYVGYKTGSGSPITGLLSGASKKDGISYKSAGGGLHYTKDKKAGNPIVGLDIIRTDTESGKNPPAITNDGSVLVRNGDGEPADFQKGGKSVYLAEIHAESVMPYISEVVTVTGSDKSDAVLKASSYGYNYYIEGDIDGAKDTYTVLAYSRTADPEDAVTNIVTMSSDLLKLLVNGDSGEGEDSEPSEEPEEQESSPEETEPESEQESTEDSEGEQESTEDSESEQGETGESEQEEGQEDSEEEQAGSDEQADYEEDSEASPEQTEEVPEDTGSEEAQEESTPVEADVRFNGDAIDVSGIEYDRMSGQTIKGKRPYHLYTTKDPQAGNPITMLYVGGDKESSETTLGIWAHGYFGTKGASNAYSYIVNEEGFAEIEKITDVYIRKPVAMIENRGDEELDLGARLTKISVLTAKEGLPDDNLTYNGLIEPTYEAPKIVEDDRDNPDSDLPASAFNTGSIITIVLGVIIAAAIFLYSYRKRKK